MREKLIKRLGVNRFFSPVKNPNLIGVYDTSIGSLNVGDEIINRSAMDVLGSIFTSEQFLKASTHDGTSSIGIYNFNQARERIVCGSNILTGRMFISGQWNVGPIDIFRMKRLVLLAVGWVDYQDSISLYSRKLYDYLLCRDRLHSVRDEYTKSKLNELGFNNVLNTSCVTMWGLTPSHCEQISPVKADKVVFTLTDYRKDETQDSKMIKVLLANYKKVYLWLQGKGDFEYFRSLNIDNGEIEILPPQLDRYDALLREQGIDYVGTRLHAGIRSLQYSNRTIIIGIDNRAKEKKVDFNLPVVNRESVVDELEEKINSNLEMNITIPLEKINEWKSQFR